MKKISIAVCATLLVASSIFAKDIKIGVIMPITGAVAAYGQTAWDGISLANKLEPTLKNGDNIKLILVDNKGDKVETATSTTRLVSNDNVAGLIGAMLTANTQQVLQIADEKKVPLISPASTADKLLDRSKYGARVTFMDSFQGTSFANYATKTLKLKTAVIVVDQSTSYSIGLAKAFRKEYQKDGGKILKELKISSGDKDFKAIVSQIGSLKPELVYMPFYHPEAALIIRQARQIGLTMQFASGDGVGNDTFIQLAGESAEGYYYTDTFDSSNPTTQRGKEFVVAYYKEKGSNYVPGFTGLGADAYFLMVNAMNRCKNPEDRECINKQIKETKNFQGVTGIISIDKKGNAIRSVVIKTIKNGKSVYKDTINP